MKHQDRFYINRDGFVDRSKQKNEITEYTYCEICGNGFASHYRTLKGAYSDDYFNIGKCGRCGLIFVNPRLNKNFRNFFYKNERHVVDWLTRKEKEARLIANLILDVLSSKGCYEGSLLEIGCGLGTLMNIASERGFRVAGIEINTNLVSYATGKTCNIIEGDFYDLTLHHASFDVIVMDQVLEHFGGPLKGLIKARELLKPNGYIFIGIPAVDWLVLFLNRIAVPWKPANSLWSPEDHLFYFKPSTIKKFLEKAGFRYIDISNTLLKWRIKKLLGLSSGRFLAQKEG